MDMDRYMDMDMDRHGGVTHFCLGFIQLGFYTLQLGLGLGLGLGFLYS